MSALNSNRINQTLTTAQISATMAAGNTVIANTPGAVGLTRQERQRLPKIDVSNKAFVEDAIAIFNSNAGLFPTYINVANMTTDFALFEQLDPIVIFFRQIVERLEDMQMLAGSEAYVNALVAYKLIGAAAEAGVPGTDAIYDQLRARFDAQGQQEETPETPDETANEDETTGETPSNG